MIIKIKGLSKFYQTQKNAPLSVALRNIDLEIEKGDVFGIIGMSGAGKTTLIRCLTGLEKPSEGQIWVAKEEFSGLSGVSLRKARQKLGMIFQHFNLFSSRTALENVLFPMEVGKRFSKERALGLLSLVGLRGKEHFYPSQLSGGEKQRVAIARALANEPEVLLCDEATSALDPKTTDSILELLSDLNEKFKLTIVLITHEMDVIKKICGKIAVLEHGEIVEKGSAVDLFSDAKHPTTRHFLQNISHEFPSRSITTSKKSEFLRLSFRGQSTNQPLISKLIKTHDIEVNILLGAIDVLKNEMVGNLVIELSGSINEREKAKAFLQHHGVICHEYS